MRPSLNVIVGLGNPGAAYAGTRHNVGFDALDRLAAGHDICFRRSWRFRAQVGKMPHLGREVLLLKPQGYVNRSGQVLALVRRRTGIGPEQVLVMVDDVDLPPGRIRVRAQGGAGGHNGLRSIIAELGSDAFPRIRIGVGPKPSGDQLVDFVLSRFAPEERTRVDEALAVAVRAAECALAEGVEAAMNKFNASLPDG